MRLDSIQILRALACNIILLGHLAAAEIKHSGQTALLYGLGYQTACSVDLFFVISGFIMVATSSQDNAAAFMWKRVFRIYPAWWFYLTLVVAAWAVLPAGMVNSAVEGSPSLIRSYLLLPDSTLPHLGVGWTLVHEMYFYVVFALILALRVPLLPALAVWATVILGPGTVYNLMVAEPRDLPVLTTMLSPITLDFIGGALVALLLRRTQALAAPALVGGVVLLAAGSLLWEPAMGVAWGTAQGMRWRILAYGVPSMLLVYGVVACELRYRPRLPRWAVILGDASYSTYLAHVLVISVLWRVVPSVPGWLDNVVLVVGAAVLCNLWGVLGYRVLERPTLRWSRRLARGHAARGWASSTA